LKIKIVIPIIEEIINENYNNDYLILFSKIKDLSHFPESFYGILIDQIIHYLFNSKGEILFKKKELKLMLTQFSNENKYFQKI